MCGRSKILHILTGTVSKNVMKDIKQEIIAARWFGLAKDGSGDEDKFLPIFIEHIGKD